MLTSLIQIDLQIEEKKYNGKQLCHDCEMKARDENNVTQCCWGLGKVRYSIKKRLGMDEEADEGADEGAAAEGAPAHRGGEGPVE